MRLYLSSFRFGNQPHRLVDLVRGNMRATVILNACDLMSDNERAIRVRQECEGLERLGFGAEELDLRRFFGDECRESKLRDLLAKRGLVWIRGGNLFVLRRAMKHSGFDRTIVGLLQQDALVYGGFSAAIAVLTPSLHGAELVDDPDATPLAYDGAVVSDGLNLLPYALAPHYRSPHPESANTERLVQYYIDRHVLFKALRDGEAIVVNGPLEEIVG